VLVTVSVLAKLRAGPEPPLNVPLTDTGPGNGKRARCYPSTWPATVTFVADDEKTAATRASTSASPPVPHG